MADTNLGEHAFAEDAAAATPDTQPMDLEAKRAELDRLRAEIEAADDTAPGEVAVIDDGDDAEEVEADLLVTMNVESLDGMEITYQPPTVTALSLFQFDMQNRRSDDGAKSTQMIEFLYEYLSEGSFWDVRRSWEQSRNPAVVLEVCSEVVEHMAQNADEPDEEAMNRSMRRIQEKAQKAEEKAKRQKALDAKRRG
jgi:hypothetical protein